MQRETTTRTAGDGHCRELTMRSICVSTLHVTPPLEPRDPSVHAMVICSCGLHFVAFLFNLVSSCAVGSLLLTQAITGGLVTTPRPNAVVFVSDFS